MKTIFNKTWLYISIVILILPLNSCKKWRKGVLEIQIIESLLTGGSTTAFLTVTVDEKYNTGYPVEVEFDLKGTNTKKITGFYYPNKSPRALGYTRNQGTPIYLGKNYLRDPEATVFVYKDPAYSGENGHWASSSYSAIKKAEKAASKNSSSSSSSSSGACPEGTWKGESCAGKPGSAILTLSSNKKGSFSNEDCKGICTPIVFNFEYEISGSTIKFMYDAQQPVVKCTGYADSSPKSPPDGSATFTCSGNTLTIKFGSTSNVYTK